jgi:hypothetical protein
MLMNFVLIFIKHSDLSEKDYDHMVGGLWVIFLKSGEPFVKCYFR